MDNTVNRQYVRRVLRVSALLVLALLTSACGMRGELYLPPAQSDPATQPAPADEPSVENESQNRKEN